MKVGDSVRNDSLCLILQFFRYFICPKQVLTCVWPMPLSVFLMSLFKKVVFISGMVIQTG